MERILWLYWENHHGKEEYPHISLCRKIIRYQCADIDVRLVTPENISEYLPEINDNLNKITLRDGDGTPCLAIKTAFIRTFLLKKYGGIYLDSDAIPLTSLRFVFDDIDKHEFVAIRRTSAPQKHISIGFMGSIPNGKIISYYARRLQQKLKTSYKYTWGEVGAHELTPIVNENLKKCYLYREKDVHPVVAEKQHLFLSKDLSLDDVLDDSSFVFMMFHKAFTGPSRAVPELNLNAAESGWLSNWNQEDLYQSDLLLSKVIRKSFPYDIAKKHLSLTTRYKIRTYIASKISKILNRL